MSIGESRQAYFLASPEVYGATHEDVIEFVESMLDQLKIMLSSTALPLQKRRAISCNIAIIKQYLRHIN